MVFTPTSNGMLSGAWKRAVLSLIEPHKPPKVEMDMQRRPYIGEALIDCTEPDVFYPGGQRQPTRRRKVMSLLKP
jgi:hypothetical protein